MLDLGCGTGRDVYAIAQLVGATGSVVGVDMTPEQLDVARQHQDYHRDVFGYDNIQFLHGFIERLDELELEAQSFDVIISNCVVNLSPDKEAVLRGVKRLLKAGGEFYFSDVYADRRVPESVRNDAVLYGECLGGALYWNDFQRLAHRHGFADPRLVSDRPLEITDPILATRAGNLRFFSATYRLFNIENLETACEDYGQAVIYRGSTPYLQKPELRLNANAAESTNNSAPLQKQSYQMYSSLHKRTQFVWRNIWNRMFLFYFYP